MEEQIVKKDVHVYIDYELSNIIEKISKSNKMTLSNTYNNLLKSGLTISDINNKLDLIYKLLLNFSNKEFKRTDKLSE